jgi:hypothetical protein
MATAKHHIEPEHRYIASGSATKNVLLVCASLKNYKWAYKNN